MSTPVYRRAGRGGAGNYFATTNETDDLESQQISESKLEAQSLSTLQADGNNSSSTKEFEKYKTTGRGGAGNWYDVAAEESAKNTQDITDPQFVAGNNRMGTGRGGLGNYEASQKIKNESGKPKDVEMVPITKEEGNDELLEGVDVVTKEDPVTVPPEAHLHRPR